MSDEEDNPHQEQQHQQPRKHLRLAAAASDDDDDDQSSDNSSASSSPSTSELLLPLPASRARKHGNKIYEDDDEEDEGTTKRQKNDGGSDAESGEDLMEDAANDYHAVEELDKYDTAEFDETEYAPVDERTRRKLERRLAERDAKERRGRVPGGLYDDRDSDEDSDEAERDRIERARRRYERAAAGAMGSTGQDGMMIEEEILPVDLENFDVALTDFAKQPEVREEVFRRFQSFLNTFMHGNGTDDDVGGGGGGDPRNRNTYDDTIRTMCGANSQSLLVSYLDLAKTQPTLALWVSDVPKIMFEIFDEVATVKVMQMFPKYVNIHGSIHVRLTELPVKDTLRDLRSSQLQELIKVQGVVTRRTGVLPRLKHTYYKCSQATCGELSDPIPSNGVKPDLCASCGKPTLKFDTERTVYSNYQRITLQESPGSVPAGRVPRQKDIVLLDDLIDSCKPGEDVEVTGIYVSSIDSALNSQNNFPVFSTLIEANYVQKREDVASLRIDESDKRKFRQLAAQPRLVERIVASIAPSIYGQVNIKTALALAMFGGREKNVDDKHRIRGDVNVLLLGDPGTAKSQCLKFVEKTAPRAVFTTGKGASAVGLTASVHKDPMTREWTLEGGALVLADRGVCLIDEFDKMNEKDRTSIHEAMEQQSISISKAGIVTTLQARCSVIAAANPISGRYDPQKSFAENVELTDPILQRFDVLCVLQDVVDSAADERLAKFVVGSHVKSHPVVMGAKAKAAAGGNGMVDDDDEDEFFKSLNIPVVNVFENVAHDTKDDTAGLLLFDQDTLRKYILFARSLRPQLNESHIDRQKIVDVYAKLRKESGENGGVPIGVRHAESIIRMSESFARMHLREMVSMDDVDMAIRVMIESFIAAQRFSVKRSLTKSFKQFLSYKKENDELLCHLLEEMAREHEPFRENDEISFPLASFMDKARELEIERFVPDFMQGKRFLETRFKVEVGRRGEDMLVRAF